MLNPNLLKLLRYFLLLNKIFENPVSFIYNPQSITRYFLVAKNRRFHVQIFVECAACYFNLKYIGTNSAASLWGKRQKTQTHTGLHQFTVTQKLGIAPVQAKAYFWYLIDKQEL